MNQTNSSLLDDVADELAKALSPAQQIEAMADFHQRTVDDYDRRIVDIRKVARAQVAELRQMQKGLLAAHAADMDAIERQIAGIETRAAADIMVAEKFQEVSRQAMEVLAS